MKENSQKWVIRGVSVTFLILTLLIVTQAVENVLHIMTVSLGFFLFGYVERLLEEKGSIKEVR
ncbi:MAG: hypothetical protein V5A72_03540, partial [Candidatus Nanohaloarchaea archaeon]